LFSEIAINSELFFFVEKVLKSLCAPPRAPMISFADFVFGASKERESTNMI
jgi:hypothetical protein